MAARKTKGTKDIPWPQATRDRIKTSMLINRLADHVLNGKDMAATQIRAAEILLKKTLPDLSAVEQVGDIATFVARVPAPAASVEAWTAATTPAPTVKPLEPDTKH
jgi:hypothetical protein